MERTYSITGATGHIGHIIVEILLKNKQKVRAIGRDAKKLKYLADKGAESWVGNMEDSSFLGKAFLDVDGIFAMIPPNFQAKNVREHQNKIGISIISAIEKAEVKNVVALSSVGAHLPEQTGIVQGLYDFEKYLASLENVNIDILRCGYFMENIDSQVNLIENQGIVGSPFKADLTFPVVATKDIAELAAGRLLDLKFKGELIEYVLGQRDLSFSEITKILADTFDINDLKYVQFSYEDFYKSLIKMGMSDSSATAMIEFSESFNNGKSLKAHKRTQENTTKTSFEDYARFLTSLRKSKPMTAKL